MLTQSQIRTAWAPRCRGPWATITLHGTGRVSVRPAIVDAVHALNACLRAWNYQTRQKDTGAYVCRENTSGTMASTHAYGIALDLNWQSNPYGRRLRTNMPPAMCAAICRIRTNNGAQVWNWGGYWSGSKDAMHFEIVCRPSDLARGINPATVPSGFVAPPVVLPPPPAAKPAPSPPPTIEDHVMYLRNQENGAIYAFTVTHYQHLTGPQWQSRVAEGAKSIDVHPWTLAGFASTRQEVFL